MPEINTAAINSSKKVSSINLTTPYFTLVGSILFFTHELLIGILVACTSALIPPMTGKNTKIYTEIEPSISIKLLDS